MRIALLGNLSKSDSPTGPELFASDYFQEINKHYETWFYRYSCSETPCTLSQKLAGNIETDNEHKIISGGLLPLFIHFIKNRYEIIHIVNYLRASIPFILWAKLSGTKIVYTLHGVIAYEMFLFNNTGFIYKLKNLFAEKVISLIADKIIGVSKSVCDKFREYYPIKIDKFSFLPPGINLSNLPLNLKRSDNKIRIITLIGMHVNQKFLNSLTDIVEKERERLTLTIIGQTEVSKSTNNVRYISKLSRKEWLSELTQHDIFINISRSETFSIAAFEAFTVGLTIFLHKEIGITEYLTPDYDYISYNQNDTKDLFNKLLLHFSKEPIGNKEFIKLESMLKKLSIQEVCKQYLLQYNSLVKL